MIESPNDSKIIGQYQSRPRHKMSSPLMTITNFQMSSHIQPSFRSHTDPSDPELQSFDHIQQSNRHRIIFDKNDDSSPKTPLCNQANQQQNTNLEKTKIKVPKLILKLQRRENGEDLQQETNSINILRTLSVPILKTALIILKVFIRLLVQLSLAKKGNSIDQYNYIVGVCTFISYVDTINSELQNKTQKSFYQRLNVEQIFTFFLLEILLLMLHEIPTIAYGVLYTIVSLSQFYIIRQYLDDVQFVIRVSQKSFLQYVIDFFLLTIMVSFFIDQLLQDPMLAIQKSQIKPRGYEFSILVSFQLMSPFSSYTLDFGNVNTFNVTCCIIQIGAYFFHLSQIIKLIKALIVENYTQNTKYEPGLILCGPLEKMLLNHQQSKRNPEKLDRVFSSLRKKLILKILLFGTQFCNSLAQITTIQVNNGQYIPEEQDILISINGGGKKIVELNKNFQISQQIKRNQFLDFRKFLDCTSNPNSFRIQGDCELLKINRDQFQDLLKAYPLQHELFHKLKHESLFQKNNDMGIICKCCKLKTHQILDCPWLAYRPDQRQLIKQFDGNLKQKRALFQRKINKFKAIKEQKYLQANLQLSYQISHAPEDMDLRMSRRSYTGFSRASSNLPRVQIKSEEDQVLSERLNIREMLLKFQRSNKSIHENTYLSPKPNKAGVCDWNTKKQNSLVVNFRQNAQEENRRQREFRQQYTDLPIVKEKGEGQSENIKVEMIQSLSLSSINLNHLHFQRESMPEEVNSQIDNNPFVRSGTQTPKQMIRSSSSPKHYLRASELPNPSEDSNFQIDQMKKYTVFFPEFNYDVVIKKVNDSVGTNEQSVFDNIISKQ